MNGGKEESCGRIENINWKLILREDEVRKILGYIYT